MKKNLLLIFLLLILQSNSGNCQSWVNVEDDYVGEIDCTIQIDSELYCGFCFYDYSVIKKWNGVYWEDLGPHVTGRIYTIACYHDTIFIGGFFNAFHQSVLKLSSDGWLTVGTGLTHQVTDLCIYNDELYASQSMYTPIGTDSICYISKWDGASWTNVAQTKWSTGFLAMKVYDNVLYVGGDFTNINDLTTNDIAFFDGAQWQCFGTGTQLCFSEIASFCVKDGLLYAGGCFLSINGISLTNVAAWNGHSWSSRGDPKMSIWRMCVFQNAIIASGAYEDTSNISRVKVEQYSNGLWSQLGGDFNSHVYGLSPYQNELYAAGCFSIIGDYLKNKIVKWTSLTGINNIDDIALFSLSPNPATNLTSLQLKLQNNLTFPVTITITNLPGEIIFEKNSTIINGDLDEEISLNKNFPQGMYFVKVSSGQQQWVKPLVVVN